ncbi:MAG: hypothetical protein HC930_05075 [Hydrococcus sp. SU_1_0]|nr:hypothetical protein [Hydrococcus sp. SU_1_0]
MFLLAGDIGGTKTILRLVEVTEVTLTEKTFKLLGKPNILVLVSPT